MIELYNKVFDIFTKITSNKKIIRKKFGMPFEYVSFLFLCGGNQSEYNSRKILSEILNSNPNNKIILSENLIKFTCNLDLLSFEHMLEAISKAIIIPVESFGTACELGAFTYNTSENKEIAILNSKYTKGSFISDGPIKILKENNADLVLTADYETNDRKMIKGGDILNINNHRLINKSLMLSKYFSYENDKIIIKDLGTFLFSILDLTYFMGFMNPKIAIKYFCLAHGQRRIVFNTPGFENVEDKVSDVIESFLLVMENTGLLKKEKAFWVPIMNNANDTSWIGSILFNKDFFDNGSYEEYYISFRNLRKKI